MCCTCVQRAGTGARALRHALRMRNSIYVLVCYMVVPVPYPAWPLPPTCCADAVLMLVMTMQSTTVLMLLCVLGLLGGCMPVSPYVELSGTLSEQYSSHHSSISAAAGAGTGP